MYVLCMKYALCMKCVFYTKLNEIRKALVIAIKNIFNLSNYILLFTIPFLVMACNRQPATSQDLPNAADNPTSVTTQTSQNNDGNETTGSESIESLDETTEAIQELKRAALTTYAEIVYASYADSARLAVELQVAIDEFVANPAAETHQAAKSAWLAAQEPYGQTEAYRFYGGPIDDEDGPEGLMNAWPLDEAYIDYVQGAESSGIINNVDAYPVIDIDLLITLNEAGSEKNISTGYHAIEFLLWGQDFSENGPGQRQYTDYVLP